MSARIDWTGKRFSGAEILGPERGAWRVRCACGAIFLVTADRLRLAQSHAVGRRKSPAHVRCDQCTSRARACAAKRHGVAFATQRRAS